MARYGGEEFAIVLLDTDAENARKLAQVICDAISNLQLTHAESEHGVVTISLGIYSDAPEKTHDSAFMLKHADEELYKAKESGRNKVQLY
ncbi:hypothetical protein MNBD_GAMMA08-1969 [hydrothermal vent metagenome]|uniref:GGDEF domain-containing protein n=1 Tax=hydrothermal vent metagenome TaxID=652676 RepID=A0A3B0XHI7_9ZZZZ